MKAAEHGADNIGMRRLVRIGWLPTLAFATLGALSMSESECGVILRYGSSATALLFVPALWRWYVASQGRPRYGRAALAGAAAANLMVILPMALAASLTGTRPTDPFGEGLGNLQILFFIVVAVATGPIGAAAAAIVTMIQRLWSRSPAESNPEPDAPAAGLSGALIAILVAPFVMLTLPTSLERKLPHGSVDLVALLTCAYVCAIPIGVVAGMWWSKIGRALWSRAGLAFKIARSNLRVMTER